MYKETLTGVLEALDDTPNVLVVPQALESESDTGEKQKVWPPWPWPPWGDDDHDGHHGDKSPLNKTERALKLAKQVVKFEKRIADASLDLYVRLLHGCVHIF